MKKKSILKGISLISFFLVCFSITSNAKIFNVSVANFSFSPANIPDVVIGDTIRWTWVAGSFSHTTTCNPASQSATSLPAGAPTWDAPMNASNQTFDYKVSVAGVYNYLCIPHQPSMSASFTVSASLPIKLSEFKVLNEGNLAVLKWTTESEDNIDYFSVQKSKTGADFAEIAKVAAAGHSTSSKSYNYTDPNTSISDKYDYYTIAIVDKQGKREYSPVGLFKSKLNISKLILLLSPNPVSRTGHLMLKFNSDKTSKMEVKVLNMEGKSVMSTTMQAYEGVNQGHLMLGNNIPAGSYLVSFELNGTKEVYRLIVK